jgi:hypothetical protein
MNRHVEICWYKVQAGSSEAGRSNVSGERSSGVSFNFNFRGDFTRRDLPCEL